jgi:hypothetical protein
MAVPAERAVPKGPTRPCLSTTEREANFRLWALSFGSFGHYCASDANAATDHSVAERDLAEILTPAPASGVKHPQTSRQPI